MPWDDEDFFDSPYSSRSAGRSAPVTVASAPAERTAQPCTDVEIATVHFVNGVPHIDGRPATSIPCSAGIVQLSATDARLVGPGKGKDVRSKRFPHATGRYALYLRGDRFCIRYF